MVNASIITLQLVITVTFEPTPTETTSAFYQSFKSTVIVLHATVEIFVKQTK